MSLISVDHSNCFSLKTIKLLEVMRFCSEFEEVSSLTT